MRKSKTIFCFRVLTIAPVLLLVSCAWRPDTPYTKFPEPDRSRIASELREHPKSQFSRAFRGDPEALHATFKRVVDPRVPLTGDAVDGRAAERFQFDIMAIRASLGNDRFFDALSRESPEIQRRMSIKGYPPRRRM